MWGFLKKAKAAVVDVANTAWNNAASFWSTEDAPTEDDGFIYAEDDLSDDGAAPEGTPAANADVDADSDDEDEEDDTEEFANDAINNARRSPAPSTFIQRLKADIDELAGEVKALRGGRVRRAVNQASSWFSRMIGGQFGKLLSAIGLKDTALKAAYYGLKAISAGLTFVNLVVETVKWIATAVVNVVVNIFSSIFSGIAGLFTGEWSMPSAGAGLAGLVGLGAVLFNRDKIAPAVNHATNLAGNAFSAAKRCATECVDATINKLGATGEFHAFKSYKDRAKKGFDNVCEGINNVCEAAQNINADDIYKMMKRGLRRAE